MSRTSRPRRSVLYMPGSNARALEKGRSLPADGLILDLEDAVAPDAKELARGQVCKAVAAGGYGRRELVIRTNGLDSPWGPDDLAAAATSGADAVLLPKVESARMVADAIAALSAAGAPDTLDIWCMMETPKGMLRADEVAGAECVRRLPGDGYLGPRQRPARGAYARATADADQPRALSAGRAGPTASRFSTASISTSPTTRASSIPATRASSSASTARR